MKLSTKLGFVALIGMHTQITSAALTSPGTCTTSDMQLTQISLSLSDSTTVRSTVSGESWTSPGHPYIGLEASTCLGVYSGNNESPGETTNRGLYGEGLLNGGNEPYALSDDDIDYILSGGDGVDPYDRMRVDIDGVDGSGGKYGLNDDPGYIQLLSGSSQSGSNNYSYNDVPGDTGNSLSNYLNFEFTSRTQIAGTGTSDKKDDVWAFQWTLTVYDGAAEELMALLNGATFDHLALSFKQANDWVVYDFNFSEILYGGASLPGLNLLQDEEYIFDGIYTQKTGYYDADGKWVELIKNPQDISHFEIWAADPPVIPVPAAVWLFGSALLGFAGVKRFKKDKS